MSANKINNKLSEDEIALYDRQIRLWGLVAQARMRSAKVLLINLCSIGTEVCKNIVLSGFGSLTILDNHIVTEEDLGSQFFVSLLDVGRKRLDAAKIRVKDLNPRVHITFDSDDFGDKDEQYFNEFDLVIGSQLSKNEMIKLNNITRSFNIPLYLSGSNGLFAYIFVDLIEFDAEDNKARSVKATTLGKISQNTEIIDVQNFENEEDNNKVYEVIKTRNYYKTFDEMLKSATLKNKLNRRQMKRLSSAVPLTLALFALDNLEGCLKEDDLRREAIAVCRQLEVPESTLNDQYIKQFVKQMGVEFSPVSAIIGGAVAQDVINILGKRQSPLNNFIVFDGITLDMPIFEM